MIDLNSLPIPAGTVVAGITWAILSGFALGPLVADRTIQNSEWHKMCETNLRSSIAAQVPQAQSEPNIGCNDIMGLFGNGADEFCRQGGGAMFDLMMIDPLAGQKEQLRHQEEARLARIAELAPSRCSCSAALVGSDRVSWGLYAGSARILGGPKNLTSELTQALHAPTCALKRED